MSVRSSIHFFALLVVLFGSVDNNIVATESTNHGQKFMGSAAVATTPKKTVVRRWMHWPLPRWNAAEKFATKKYSRVFFRSLYSSIGGHKFMCSLKSTPTIQPTCVGKYCNVFIHFATHVKVSSNLYKYGDIYIDSSYLQIRNGWFLRAFGYDLEEKTHNLEKCMMCLFEPVEQSV